MGTGDRGHGDRTGQDSVAQQEYLGGNGKKDDGGAGGWGRARRSTQHFEERGTLEGTITTVRIGHWVLQTTKGDAVESKNGHLRLSQPPGVV